MHIGAGRGLGHIDLPLVREKATNFPYIPGSAIKGVIADSYQADENSRKSNPALKAAFGITDSSNNESGSNSGSLVFTDARLIALPIRSIYGTFAWTASPAILQRLKRDLQAANPTAGLPDIDVAEKETVNVTNSSVLSAKDNKVFLEDLDLTAATNDAAKQWAEFIAGNVFVQQEERDAFVKRFAVLHDDVFNFLSETGTSVDAHIKMDKDSKTVDKKNGGLWYEESLPAETILSGILWCDKVFGNKELTQEKLLTDYGKNIPLLQFGGKATTGKGLVRFITEGGNK
jgi:CRISPR-associated protein Cmr4